MRMPGFESRENVCTESREPGVERGTLDPGAESRIRKLAAGRLQLAARGCREVNWSSGQLGAQRAKRRAVSAGGSWQRAARCRVRNVECGMRNDKRRNREPGGILASGQLGNLAMGEGGDKETRGRTAQGRVVGIQKATGRGKIEAESEMMKKAGSRGPKT